MGDRIFSFSDVVGTSHVLRLLVFVLLPSLCSADSSFQWPSTWMLLSSTFTLRIRVSIVVKVVIAGAMNGTAVCFGLVISVVIVWWCRLRIGVSCGRCKRLNRVVRVKILAQIVPLIQGIRRFSRNGLKTQSLSIILAILGNGYLVRHRLC